MDNSIEIVVSSRKSHEENSEFLDNVRFTCGHPCHVNYIMNDGSISLTSAYNAVANKFKGEDKIICFMHDDIEFLRKGWGEELVRMFNKHEDYSIIGVAGTTSFDKKGRWWTFDKKYGQVMHKHNGNAWVTAFSELLNHDLEEVCIIDGLFMAVKMDRVDFLFDEKYPGFHHYDTSFCLKNFLDGKHKIGVTTNIRLAHKSIGETTDGWYENLAILNDEFGKYYPIKLQNKYK